MLRKLWSWFRLYVLGKGLSYQQTPYNHEQFILVMSEAAQMEREIINEMTIIMVTDLDARMTLTHNNANVQLMAGFEEGDYE